ncbi:MAG TPA: DUF2911 domain-containing protein [Chitinophagaceae bacterium]|nr:DUF2911 domain-containing protein [Chitinophagaceae bacterium]
MKRVFILIAVLLSFKNAVLAQEELPPVDKSPLDICYFPVDYPHLKVQSQVKDQPVARVIYSRPKTEGRAVFGGLISYGKLWRMGANEATEIEFYRPVTISGKKIAKGRYTLYAIVQEESWTIILNKDTDVWGSFVYNEAKDIVRAEVPVSTLAEPVENLSMTFKEKSNTEIKLVIAWDTVKVALPINI